MTNAVTDAIYGLKRSITAVLADDRGLVFLSVTAGFFLMNGLRFIVPALLPFFRVEFDMSLTTAGLILTLLWLAYAGGQIPGGMLGDRIGERNILAASCFLGLCTAILITVSRTQIGFVLGAVGFGVSLGLFSPTRMTVLTDLYPERSGTVIGINLGISSLGLTILPVVAASIAGILGWRLGFGFLIPFIAIAVVALWMTVPKRTSEPVKGGRSIAKSFLRPLRKLIDPPVLAAVGSMVCMHFLFQAFSSFYPTFLVDVKGLSEQQAATIFGLFFALGLVLQPGSGLAGDRIGWRKTMLLIIGSAILGLVLLPVADSIVLIAIVTGVLSVQRGFWPVANAYLIDLFPDDVQASGLGISRTGYILLGTPGPLLVGAIADAGYFEEAFLLLAGVAGLGALLICYLYRLE